ncbi:MAG: hydrogenase maturation protease [Chrysiogenetes bacterium]|nr:hydrogenase maturation protease [Chrysiogenetes bacterium]
MSIEAEGGAVVIAVGNEMRGDDAAGLEVAARLERTLPAGVALKRTRGDATALMELWKGRALAVVVDAVSGGGAPGEILEIDALEEGLPADLKSASTHDFGLAQALELGELMDALPGSLRVIGIVGENFEIGAPISDAVADALDDAAARVTAALSQAGG